MIKLEVVPNDSKEVAKVVIIDEGKVLMLKRSNYVNKYSGEWDLPGGHIRVGEDFEKGMRREVKEETDLDIEDLKFIEKIENLSFYLCEYNKNPIKLSHEHTKYRFFEKENLSLDKKFEKVALKALEMQND